VKKAKNPLQATPEYLIIVAKSTKVDLMENDPQKLLAHLGHKWESKKCPMCGQQAWVIGKNVFELREFHEKGFVIGPGPIVPIIPVTCSNCGNTVLINAFIAGISPRPAEPADSQEKRTDNE